MKKIKTKINHRDERGLIIDLLEKKKINAITYITQKKGKVRGNHFHKKTIQWNYLLKGKIKLVTQKKNKNIKKMNFSKGDLVVTTFNEAHAMKAIQDSEIFWKNKNNHNHNGIVFIETTSSKIDNPLFGFKHINTDWGEKNWLSLVNILKKKYLVIQSLHSKSLN